MSRLDAVELAAEGLSMPIAAEEGMKNHLCSCCFVALNEIQPDALPAPLVSAFTPGWEDGINFLSQCQLRRGFTLNCAEFCS